MIHQVKKSTLPRDVMTLSESLKENISHLERELSSYPKAFFELEDLLRDASIQLSDAEEAVPVKAISISRDG